MRETCFCGRAGEIEDREPVYAGDGEWALACPACGHLDHLRCLTPAARHRTLTEAMRRHATRRPSGAVRRVPGVLAPLSARREGRPA
ncbi:MAG TPA: hypothetical protein VFW96_16775 [Thermomicrobiales bacterium]|nr:hypothetical protein [Thermomicrobiales bacterium]